MEKNFISFILQKIHLQKNNNLHLRNLLAINDSYRSKSLIRTSGASADGVGVRAMTYASLARSD